MARNKKIYYGTGKRKTSIAKARLTSGTGKIVVNGKDVYEYFPFETLVMNLSQGLVLTDNSDKFDVDATVYGGGFSGQAEALRLAIVKALMEYDTVNPEEEESYRKIFKKNGLVTRDSRIKERKKPGLKKARRAPQFSKR